MSTNREKAEQIAKSPELVAWIEARLVEEHHRELAANDDKAREMLISKGWSVNRLGESWAVGLGDRYKYEGVCGWTKEGGVVGGALALVDKLRALATKMEDDLK